MLNPVPNIVRWLIGNALLQYVGEIAGSNPVLTTNVIRLTAKNGINEECYRWLQTLIIYKGVNSIITLNSQVSELDIRYQKYSEIAYMRKLFGVLQVRILS